MVKRKLLGNEKIIVEDNSLDITPTERKKKILEQTKEILKKKHKFIFAIGFDDIERLENGFKTKNHTQFITCEEIDTGYILQSLSRQLADAIVNQQKFN